MVQMEPHVTQTPNELDWSQLNHGMVVHFRDGALGLIEHVWFSAQHHGIGQMIVRLTTPESRMLAVPFDCVRFIDALGVAVDMDSAPVELLPTHSAT